MVDKEIIKKNFSRYARYYDRYASIQNLCGLKLVDKLRAGNLSKILDIGCGTGNFTRLLRERYPRAKMTALDISGEMIEIAKEKFRNDRIEFIVADGETINFKEKFDLISSNATFQWFEDLKTSLSRYKTALNEKGVISFSIFGPLTFNELNESLTELCGEDIIISSRNFPERKTIEKILKGLFKEAEVEQVMYKERHTSLPELLKKIKYTGTRGNGVYKKGFWTSRTLGRVEEIYKRRFKDIIATYEVFFCKGMKDSEIDVGREVK